MDTRLREWAPVPLRIILGFGFVFHGFPKVFTAAGHESITGMLAGIGVPAPGFAGYLVGGLEFFGGLALLLGLMVRPIAALGAVEMLFAALLVHLPAGFNFMNITGMTDQGPQFGMPGYEVPLLYLFGFVSLILSGPGLASLGDRAEDIDARVIEAEREMAGRI